MSISARNQDTSALKPLDAIWVDSFWFSFFSVTVLTMCFSPGTDRVTCCRVYKSAYLTNDVYYCRWQLLKPWQPVLMVKYAGDWICFAKCQLLVRAVSLLRRESGVCFLVSCESASFRRMRFFTSRAQPLGLIF